MKIAGNPGPGLIDLVEDAEMEHLWVAASGKQALGLGPTGIGVFRVSSGPQVAAWDDVESMTRALGHVVVIEVRGGADLKFPLAETHSQRELVEAVPAEHRTRLGLTTGALAPRRSDSTHPGQRGSESPASATQGTTVGRTPGQLLWTLLGVGILLSFVAGIILAASWPEGELLLGREVREDDGSFVGLMVGYLLAGAGAAVTTVSLIGFGVRLGIRAARADAAGG